MPAMHLVRTDLPAPLSPQSAVTCPAGRSRSTLYSAWTGPKCFSTPRSLSNGSAPRGDSLTTCATSPLYPLEHREERAPPRTAAAPLCLADAGCGAGGRPGGAAQRRLVGGGGLGDGCL